MSTPIITGRERVGMGSALKEGRRDKTGFFYFETTHPVSCMCVYSTIMEVTAHLLGRHKSSYDTLSDSARLAQQKWLRKEKRISHDEE